MIHISQEELLRKIESEHDCTRLDSCEEAKNKKKNKNKSSGSKQEERGDKEKGLELNKTGEGRAAAACSAAGLPLSEAEAEAAAIAVAAAASRKQSSCDSVSSCSSGDSATNIGHLEQDISSMLLMGHTDNSKIFNSLNCKQTRRRKRSDVQQLYHPCPDLPLVVDGETETETKTKTTKTTDRNNNYDSSSASNKQQVTDAPTESEDEIQAVLITGCGSKIGSNIAVAFAAQGLKVALVDFDIQQTEAVARECQEKSPKNRVPLQIVADMSQLAEAHKVIDRTIAAFGRLDVLVNTVNNASLMEAKFNASNDDDPHVFEQYHKIIANNMHAVTYLCISAAPFLRKTKGSIVNVSSLTNNETGSNKFAYRMSKAGISTLTKCLATDLAPDIKVICVSPKTSEQTNPT